jgi:hypothetical protein
MKRILLAASVASAALVTSGLTAPAALAAGTNATCDSATSFLPPGTYQNVTVPAQATCNINSSDIITGNVTVATGATLNDGIGFGDGAPIGGNLQADHAQAITVWGGSIGGNLQLTATSAGNGVCGGQHVALTVGKNLTVQDSSESSFIGAINFECAPVTVGGNMTVQNNPGIVLVAINTVAGNISVHDNTGGGFLDRNSAGGNCQLFNDNPPISGSLNTVPPGHQNTCNRAA